MKIIYVQAMKNQRNYNSQLNNCNIEQNYHLQNLYYVILNIKISVMNWNKLIQEIIEKTKQTCELTYNSYFYK